MSKFPLTFCSCSALLAGPPPGANAGSLLHLLDRTHMPSGSRLLREWVARPLTDLPSIHARLDAVEEIAASGRECNIFRDILHICVYVNKHVTA
jgi:DNA mismatch repair ATPase MutS